MVDKVAFDRILSDCFRFSVVSNIPPVLRIPFILNFTLIRRTSGRNLTTFKRNNAMHVLYERAHSVLYVLKCLKMASEQFLRISL
jgi:hypothetical protein